MARALGVVPGSLRLRFAGVLEVTEQLQVVRRMREAHERRIAELERRLATHEFDDPLHRLTIEFGVGWNSWAQDWTAALERRLADREGPDAVP
jgi:hypothetical protein